MVHLVGSVAPGDFGEVVRDRRSIRAFRADPVGRPVLEEILKDVIWAPSPHNSQPWRFTVLFEAHDKARLAAAMAARLGRELRADGVTEEVVTRQTQRSQQRITLAPAAILCSLVADGLVSYPDERRTDLEWQMAVQSAGAALQTLFLSAQTRGLGTCWMAAPMYCPEEVREALDLPASYEPQALVLMGYAEALGRARERRPLEEVAHFR
jgi:coenzyme F420-0:L-glutamate ligase/coenzyme F420-1:gamma-L-glutamate ligase